MTDDYGAWADTLMEAIDAAARALRAEAAARREGEMASERLAEMMAERCANLEAAIRDIDAHATPIARDDDGMVTGGYVVSVGSLHRALALCVGTAPREQGETPT